MVYVVMGVSGCGKTTVGQLLAQRLGVPFFDADGFHPQTNVDKMKKGIPLTDADRAPWLANMASHITQWQAERGAVLACSALKQMYRDVLSGGAPGAVRFVFVHGTRELIAERMRARKDHFFPVALLDSQFAALEEPREAIRVSADASPEAIVGDVMSEISREGGSR